MSEPAIDLGLVLAIVSSYRDNAISDRVIAFGEVGLSGEVRSVQMVEQRIREAEKLGFETVILPKSSLKGLGYEPTGVSLIGVETIREAVDVI